jgi:hypothetical protein
MCCLPARSVLLCRRTSFYLFAIVGGLGVKVQGSVVAALLLSACKSEKLEAELVGGSSVFGAQSKASRLTLVGAKKLSTAVVPFASFAVSSSSLFAAAEEANGHLFIPLRTADLRIARTDLLRRYALTLIEATSLVLLAVSYVNFTKSSLARGSFGVLFTVASIASFVNGWVSLIWDARFVRALEEEIRRGVRVSRKEAKAFREHGDPDRLTVRLVRATRSERVVTQIAISLIIEEVPACAFAVYRVLQLEREQTAVAALASCKASAEVGLFFLSGEVVLILVQMAVSLASGVLKAMVLLTLLPRVAELPFLQKRVTEHVLERQHDLESLPRGLVSEEELQASARVAAKARLIIPGLRVGLVTQLQALLQLRLVGGDEVGATALLAKWILWRHGVSCNTVRRSLLLKGEWDSSASAASDASAASAASAPAHALGGLFRLCAAPPGESMLWFVHLDQLVEALHGAQGSAQPVLALFERSLIVLQAHADVHHCIIPDVRVLCSCDASAASPAATAAGAEAVAALRRIAAIYPFKVQLALWSASDALAQACSHAMATTTTAAAATTTADNEAPVLVLPNAEALARFSGRAWLPHLQSSSARSDAETYVQQPREQEQQQQQLRRRLPISLAFADCDLIKDMTAVERRVLAQAAHAAVGRLADLQELSRSRPDVVQQMIQHLRSKIVLVGAESVQGFDPRFYRASKFRTQKRMTMLDPTSSAREGGSPEQVPTQAGSGATIEVDLALLEYISEGGPPLETLPRTVLCGVSLLRLVRLCECDLERVLVRFATRLLNWHRSGASETQTSLREGAATIHGIEGFKRLRARDPFRPVAFFHRNSASLVMLWHDFARPAEPGPASTSAEEARTVRTLLEFMAQTADAVSRRAGALARVGSFEFVGSLRQGLSARTSACQQRIALAASQAHPGLLSDISYAVVALGTLAGWLVALATLLRRRNVSCVAEHGSQVLKSEQKWDADFFRQLRAVAVPSSGGVDRLEQLTCEALADLLAPDSGGSPGLEKAERALELRDLTRGVSRWTV